MADLPDLQFSRLVTGQKLAWREWGSGKPLLMLHGWSMSSVVFSEVAPLLAPEFRLICPDLPGHGFSEPLPDISMDNLAAAVGQWAEQLNLDNPALLGWSLGGQIALQLAASNQLQVSHLLLVSTTPRFCQGADWCHGLPVTQVKALERNIGRAYEKTLGDFFNLQFVGEDLPKERCRQILKFAVRSGRLPQPETAKKTLQLLGQADLRSVLGSIRLPTLVMHGALDKIIPVTAGEFLATQLPNAQLHRLPQIGHAPFFSRPQESIEQWRKFLQ